jgi:hypothetical protein
MSNYNDGVEDALFRVRAKIASTSTKHIGDYSNLSSTTLQH